MSRRKIIFLADMESFYASVETALNPSLRGKPVVVCGDPKLRHGIVLAASREAKACGVKTGQPAWECRRLCPEAVFVRPQMGRYLDCSLRITGILEQFTDRVVPYSIDEQFLDLSGCEGLFGSPPEMARLMISRIWDETGIRCRIGLGENPLQAKMACDNFAKKNGSAFFELNSANYAAHAWPLPVGALFGVGHRMQLNLNRIGVRTIGHLAGLPHELPSRRWGVNGEILWLNAHGIDYSAVRPGPPPPPKGVGHCMTLPRDYARPEEISVVLLELAEEVCFRARSIGRMGRVVHVYCRGADFESPSGFSRQKKLPEPTAVTMEIYPHILGLFRAHWDGRPVRALGVSLGGLVDRRSCQLSMVNRREVKDALDDAADGIRRRFGPTGLFRAASLSSGAQLFRRAGLIGGHEA